MHKIIVSDIFGKTKSLEKISDSLSGTSEIFDPYDSVLKSFDTEQDAYSYFMSEVGLEKYTEKFIEYLKKFKEPVSILGFSVGASVIWKLSEDKRIHNIMGAVCFYSSQIRNYKEVRPRFPIQLIFPSHENNFVVDTLIKELKKNKKVTIHKSLYLHGFMNFHSENFNPVAYMRYLEPLSNVLFNKSLHTSIFTLE